MLLKPEKGFDCASGFSARHGQIVVPDIERIVPVKQHVPEGGLRAKHGRSENDAHSRRFGQMFLHDIVFVMVRHGDFLQADDVCV